MQVDSKFDAVGNHELTLVDNPDERDCKPFIWLRSITYSMWKDSTKTWGPLFRCNIFSHFFSGINSNMTPNNQRAQVAIFLNGISFFCEVAAVWVYKRGVDTSWTLWSRGEKNRKSLWHNSTISSRLAPIISHVLNRYTEILTALTLIAHRFCCPWKLFFPQSTTA